MKIALVQMSVTSKKQENIDVAIKNISRAAKEGAELVVLPEMFCCPYSNEYFSSYAEKAKGHVWKAMSDAADKNNIYLIAGSMPEIENGLIYNTSFVFDRRGRQIARHRKMHLFDVDIEGGIKFFESETFSAGDDITVFDTEYGKFGLCICFDMRFAELSLLMSSKGAQVIFVPAAFNMTTGPAHWEIMFRQRAVDNQLFTVGVAPARDDDGVYVSYANSIICSPWGECIYRAGAEETTKIVDIDLLLNKKIRQQLPLVQSRRKDIYCIQEVVK